MKYLITGGGFGNKGAESMLYTLITEIREHDSNSEIIVQSLHGWDFSKENDIYNFKLIKEDAKTTAHALISFKLFSDKLRKFFGSKSVNLEFYNIIKDIDVIFDISGYALSSQWGKHASKRLLQLVLLAKKYKKRIILMPQSFGPFDYPKSYKISKNHIKSVLSYCEAIFCREEHGYNLLKEMRLKNIILSNDMVLQSIKPYCNVFCSKPETKEISIKEKSVLIIPNMRVFERTNKELLINVYCEAINMLLAQDYNIYLSQYADDDKVLCEEIKTNYAHNNKVIILEYLNCIEYERILKSFEFVISSRYHSIVHSYKNYIPCIVLGWAVKYQALLKSVNQSDMCFNGTEQIDIDKFKSAVIRMIEHHKDESLIIEENVKKIQKNNCFDIVWKKLANEH